MARQQKYSWECDLDTPEYYEAIRREANSINMGLAAYVRLPVAEKKNLFHGTATPSSSASLEVTKDAVLGDGKVVQTKPLAESGDDRDFWLVLTIGGTGLYIGLDSLVSHTWLIGGIFTAASVAVMAPLSPTVRNFVGFKFHRRALWALGITAWLLIAARVGLQIWPLAHPEAIAPTGFTQAQIDEKVALATRPLEEQIRALKAALAATNRPAPNPQTDLIGGPYVRSDVDRLIALLIALNNSLTRQAAPLFDSYQQQISDYKNWVQSPFLGGYITGLATLELKLVDAQNAVEKIVTENSVYKRELDSAVDDQNIPTKAAAQISAFSDEMIALKSLPKEQQIPILERQAVQVANAMSAYKNWVQTSIRNTEAKIQHLRAYRP